MISLTKYSINFYSTNFYQRGFYCNTVWYRHRVWQMDLNERVAHGCESIWLAVSTICVIWAGHSILSTVKCIHEIFNSIVQSKDCRILSKKCLLVIFREITISNSTASRDFFNDQTFVRKLINYASEQKGYESDTDKKFLNFMSVKRKFCRPKVCQQIIDSLPLV